MNTHIRRVMTDKFILKLIVFIIDQVLPLHILLSMPLILLYLFITLVVLKHKSFVSILLVLCLRSRSERGQKAIMYSFTTSYTLMTIIFYQVRGNNNAKKKL